MFNITSVTLQRLKEYFHHNSNNNWATTYCWKDQEPLVSLTRTTRTATLPNKLFLYHTEYFQTAAQDWTLQLAARTYPLGVAAHLPPSFFWMKLFHHSKLTPLYETLEPAWRRDRMWNRCFKNTPWHQRKQTKSILFSERPPYLSENTH